MILTPDVYYSYFIAVITFQHLHARTEVVVTQTLDSLYVPAL